MTSTLSRRRVYWATQETVSDWLPTAVNTAGSFDLATDGEILTGRRTKSLTLIWTTTDLWSMSYIGGDFVYSFRQEGMNCGLVSQRAVAMFDTAAYWMGYRKFFCFDGFVKTIPCDVDEYVFGSFNDAQAGKVWALGNPIFNEATWYYPSANATDCDRYVTYNYVEEHWTFGTLQRSAGVTLQPGASAPTPILIDSAGNIYDHETGNDRGGSSNVFLESGPIEAGNGDNVLRAQRLVPDDKTSGDVTASIYTTLFPDQAETLNGPYPLASPTSIRLTARQVRIRVQESVATAWRLGVIRLGVIVGGRR